MNKIFSYYVDFSTMKSTLTMSADGQILCMRNKWEISRDTQEEDYTTYDINSSSFTSIGFSTFILRMHQFFLMITLFPHAHLSLINVSTKIMGNTKNNTANTKICFTKDVDVCGIRQSKLSKQIMIHSLRAVLRTLCGPCLFEVKLKMDGTQKLCRCT